MKTLRSKLTYANVMATVAVFLALGGAAYAATKLPKNSVGTKQLKNGAVTADKVQSGSLTGTQINASTLGTVPNATHAVSADNATHASSAESATNATHADNATHASSAESANHASSSDNATQAESATNATQLGGIPASHFVTAASTLASGQTETGVFGAAGSENGDGVAAVDFVPKLAAEPAHIEDVGQSTNEHCPGPGEAAAGYLCVYEGWNFRMTFEAARSPNNAGGGATPAGTDLYWTSEAGGNVRGEWAYTAP